MSTRDPYTVVTPATLKRSSKGTITFEGKAYGSGVSMFIIEYTEVGIGPLLHKHPYPETWILRGGRALFQVNDEELEAEVGSILVVEPETPHKFTNLGPDPLDIICIHPSPVFIQEDLE